MPGLDPSIVKHFLPLDTKKFLPKRQHLRCQRADLFLCSKEDVVKQIDVRFSEVCNYSEWVANIVPVEKKNGKVRVCIDYRDLNKASPKDNFPLPHIDVLVDSTARHMQFSFMDGFSGYNQIQMAEEDKVKTTFIKMWGTFCYKVMPFGLKNVGATYQRVMVTLFHDMMHKEIEVYVDDMIAKSKKGEDHLVNLKQLFDHLKKYKLRLNPAKCTFSFKSKKLLGFVVSEKSIEVNPNKVKAIMELPPPSTVREVRSFLGRLNYIARFIANLTDKCQQLFCLLPKNPAVEWDNECQKAFDTIKAYLVQPSVLVPPSLDRPLILYLTIGKMCCALVWVMQRLRQCTLCHTARLLSKTEPLKYLLDSPSSMRNIAKWRSQLTEYDIEYVSRTSMKGQAIADHLAEFPIDDDTPINPDLPDEGILQATVELKVKELEVFGDSMLTIFQTIKQWKTKDWKLVPYHEYLEELLENFENIPFMYTLRMKNQFADALATLASKMSIMKENLIDSLEFEIAEGPAHCDVIEAIDGKPWTLRRIAAHFFLSGETLYRHSFDAILVWCVDENEAQRLMEEVHEGSCGPHMNGLMLAKKIMRSGYFWFTMETHYVEHVRHCHLC
ncbi:hypothetical protein CRG98_037169 [Punica granatum]|uniref:Reverse transcriptase domain-containing protein n=1 Tax=Punica granatum TaxID=22663 RepID=A0A2I0IEM7_PUNGR|nr:hypothetical protein CRG98_037169 [Punica granatum]